MEDSRAIRLSYGTSPRRQYRRILILLAVCAVVVGSLAWMLKEPVQIKHRLLALQGEIGSLQAVTNQVIYEENPSSAERLLLSAKFREISNETGPFAVWDTRLWLRFTEEIGAPRQYMDYPPLLCGELRRPDGETRLVAIYQVSLTKTDDSQYRGFTATIVEPERVFSSAKVLVRNQPLANLKMPTGSISIHLHDFGQTNTDSVILSWQVLGQTGQWRLRLLNDDTLMLEVQEITAQK